MMNLPFATPLNFTHSHDPHEEKEQRWYIFCDDQLLIDDKKKSILNKHNFTLKRQLYIGRLGDKDLFAGEIDSTVQLPQGLIFFNFRKLFSVINDEDLAIAGRALQLIHWDRTHVFCGFCGVKTLVRKNERCRECSSCKHLSYPKIAPVVMALVKKENSFLLARSAYFSGSWYSVIAGFVDAGETLEQAVAREVFEEVGIKVKNVNYFASQPWPFPSSLIIAFTCDWESGEINIDPNEIATAEWFDRDHLPELPPAMSLSRIIIDTQIRDS